MPKYYLVRPVNNRSEDNCAHNELPLIGSEALAFARRLTGLDPLGSAERSGAGTWAYIVSEGCA
jgi:hypothetical protein